MGKGLKANLRLRRAQSSRWREINPVLQSGEPGVELDTYKLKIGNGVTAWNDLPYATNGADSSQSGGILVVDSLPEEGNNLLLYKVENTQNLYYWDDVNNTFIKLNYKPEEVGNNVLIVESLPYEGQDNVLYKVRPTQKFYFWNSQMRIFENLVSSEDDLNIKGGIEVVETLNDLPDAGRSDMLYKVLANEMIYTWNETRKAYAILNSGSGGGGIVVVNSFADLPEIGENDVLYKIHATQLLYMWNALTNMYDKLGQGGGAVEQEGYEAKLQNTLESRIFAVRKGESVYLGFRYSSVDAEGMNDGPGIGTLVVNEVKKATIAVPQKANNIEITEYLRDGENTVQLTVKNSQNKTAELIYQINIINLSLEDKVVNLDKYYNSFNFNFVIYGDGDKKIYYYMDNELIGYEELYSSGEKAHTFTVPMQPYGPHLFRVWAEMTSSNIDVKSNELINGMIFTGDDDIGTHILSTFVQEKSEQGEVLTIPYMVYNPLSETQDIVLRVYNEDGTIYSERPRTVDQIEKTWTLQDYPAGDITLEIETYSSAGEKVNKTFKIKVNPSTFDKTPIDDNLALEFSANGRSNYEANPAHWSYGDITSTFSRFAWSVADGWVASDSGETVLRFLPKNKMEINYQPFATDKRDSGYSIEIEMATHNVKDYDSVVMSCVDQGQGFVVKSQSLVFKSQLSDEIIMQFKEDDRVRITITIEPKTASSFMKFYVNGVLCAIEQYNSEKDTFKQSTPQNLVIGSDTCGLDIYKMRFYNRCLSDAEQLNNFICDRSTIAEKIAAKERNDIYTNGQLTIDKLPASLPYLVMRCEQLPQFKDDKKNDKSVYFVDKLHPERSFSAEGCQFDVQGTSSAVYPIKNFKVKFTRGITYNNGTTSEGYPIREGDLISKCLCLKADYASSEQANNVMLVDYYDKLVRNYFLTPAQQEDERIRVGIAGRPIVLFWENTATGEIKFQGQYNMNNDKSNENVFGFDRTKWPNTECWEFSNNTSNRCLFKTSEWEEEVYDKEKDAMVPAWTKDFEARFPDIKPAYDDYTQFKRFCDFIVSTDRNQKTNERLSRPVDYEGKTYTEDTEEYRLAKFKNEFSQYGYIDAFVFYYVYTETFHLMDSRAKNMFLTTFDGQHWFPIPYDMDTAIGINNEGKLVFEYDIEDDEKVNNENVFTGQESVLWRNIRDAYQARRYELYKDMRLDDKFSYQVIASKMKEHQEVWPEAIWNEDAKVKYLDVYLTKGEEYFDMCQGNKAIQRDWWLFNAFKYRDSKYQCGDSNNYTAFFRAYAPADMEVTPYQHLYSRVDFTDSYPVSKRGKRNQPQILKYPGDTASDTEIFLRSADRMASFGDLSKYNADEVKFAEAVKLQELKVGSSEPGYQNHKLTSINLGNNQLLGYLNVENCINLVDSINLTQCYNLETFLARGTRLISTSFPIGGHLTTLHLPGTFTDLTLRNQHNITDFSMDSYNQLRSLWIDDTPNLPIEEILLNSPKLDRIRLVNTTWSVSNEENLRVIFEKLKSSSGINGNGSDSDKAIVTGFIEIDSISDELLRDFNLEFSELVFIVNGKSKLFVRYLNRNNDLLYSYIASIGDNVIDPILEGHIQTPSIENTEDTQYEFSHWSGLPENIQGSQNIIAMYDIKYKVQFHNGNNDIIDTQWVLTGTAAVDPILKGITVPSKESDAQYHYYYDHWIQDITNIIGPIDIYPFFGSILRDYPVYFYNDDVCVQESRIFYGDYASYNGDESSLKKIVGGFESDYYEFAHWASSDGNSGISEPITGTTYFYAQYVFDGYIEDSWQTIAANAAKGQTNNYGYGGKKKETITYTYRGKQITQEIEFEIIDKNHDKLLKKNSNYNNGATTAALTFRGVLTERMAFNESGKPTLDAGGWAQSDRREWLNSKEFYDSLPEGLRNAIKEVVKESDNGYYDYNSGSPSLTTTTDKIFIASAEEMNTYNSRYTMSGQGTPYAMFTNNMSRDIDKVYWTRSTAGKQQMHLICAVDLDGRGTTIGGGNILSVMFCFCI